MVNLATSAQFISCDWGTSRFRLRLVDRPQNRVVTEYITDQGILTFASIHPAGAARAAALSEVLAQGIAALGARAPDCPVVMSGMASSTLGWQLIPYAPLPSPIDGNTLRFVDVITSGRTVRIISGLQAANDVMRGEETELVGLFASPDRRPLAEDCLVILPGTHSKHVRLQAGQITEFTTHLTGELYGRLARDSTLATQGDTVFDDAAFLAGIHASRQQGMSAALFQTRARVLLGRLAAKYSPAFLSGILIGAEISTLVGTSVPLVVLAAGETLAHPYALALNELMPLTIQVRIPPIELAHALVQGHAKLLGLS